MGYRFQEKYTGQQIIIWNAPDEVAAGFDLYETVRRPKDWILLGTVDRCLFNISTKEIN